MVWVEGLTAEGTGGISHEPAAVEAGSGQVNVKLRPMVREGRWRWWRGGEGE